MMIPDLQVFPPNHPPSPFPFPVVMLQQDDELAIGQLPDSVVLYAIGWLGDQIPTTGDVPDECIARLFSAYDSKETISDGTKGWHDCEICATPEQRRPGGRIGPVVQWRGTELRLYGHGHHLVRLGPKVYMCPVLILHYILDHHYQPPPEFVDAVVRGTFLTTHDLVPCNETIDEWFAERGNVK